MRWSIGGWRLWLFGTLVVVAASLMVVSFIMPWWTASIYGEDGTTIIDGIRIYGHGLQHSLAQLRNFIIKDETPFYETVLAWAYLGVSAGLVLLSIGLKGKKGRWLLGGTGLIYVAYAAIAAFVVIAERLREVGLAQSGVALPLQGHGFFIASGEGGGADIYTTLRFGYYLAYAAGLMCLVLALFRDKIVGKPKHGG